MTGSPAAVAAVRLGLDPGPPIDPFALAGPDGILFRAGDQALVGLGTALTIPLRRGLEAPSDLDRAAEALAAIPCEDRFDPSGTGVVGFGALPFERSQPAALVVPEVTFGVDASGREWVTVVAADRADLPTGPADLRSRLSRWAAPARRRPRRSPHLPRSLPSPPTGHSRRWWPRHSRSSVGASWPKWCWPARLT